MNVEMYKDLFLFRYHSSVSFVSFFSASKKKNPELYKTSPLDNPVMLFLCMTLVVLFL